MVWKIQDELWRSVLSLAVLLHLESLKQFHQLYQRWSASITQEKDFFSGNLLKGILIFHTIFMEQKISTFLLYPAAPLGSRFNGDLEWRLEKESFDVKSFSNSSNNLGEMITYFKDENHKKTKVRKTLNTTLKSLEIDVIMGATSIPITSSSTGF